MCSIETVGNGVKDNVFVRRAIRWAHGQTSASHEALLAVNRYVTLRLNGGHTDDRAAPKGAKNACTKSCKCDKVLAGQ